MNEINNSVKIMEGEMVRNIVRSDDEIYWIIDLNESTISFSNLAGLNNTAIGNVIKQGNNQGTLLSKVTLEIQQEFIFRCSFRAQEYVGFNKDSNFTIQTNSVLMNVPDDFKVLNKSTIHKVASYTNAKRLYEYARKDIEISPLFELVGKLPSEDYRQRKTVLASRSCCN